MYRLSQLKNYDNAEKKELSYLMPWLELLLKCSHQKIWPLPNKIEPTYVYRASLMTEETLQKLIGHFPIRVYWKTDKFLAEFAGFDNPETDFTVPQTRKKS